MHISGGLLSNVVFFSSQQSVVFHYFYSRNVSTYGACSSEFFSLHSRSSYPLPLPTIKSLLKIFEFVSPEVEVGTGNEREARRNEERQRDRERDWDS